MTDDERVTDHAAEAIGGPSDDYERPEFVPSDDDVGYGEGEEEPSGEEEDDDEG